MNWKKHEGSLLKVFSDAGSTPAASTNYTLLNIKTRPLLPGSLPPGLMLV